MTGRSVLTLPSGQRQISGAAMLAGSLARLRVHHQGVTLGMAGTCRTGGVTSQGRSLPCETALSNETVVYILNNILITRKYCIISP
jgi:hypothetical protein